MSQRIHLLIQGRVQGVFFRQTTVKKAHDLGLAGWVRNLPDGRVEVTAEGEKDALEALLAYAHQGPPAARVHAVEVSWQDATGEFERFSVRY